MDKEASLPTSSPVKVMPSPPSHTTNLPPEQDDHPPSSPYDTIHQDLGLYKAQTRSNPTIQFFEAMKNLKSPPGTSSAMSTPTQHSQPYMRACEIESYGEDGEVYSQEKLLVRPHDPIFMNEHVPKTFVFGKSFFMSAQLSKRPFPLRRLHNWYIMMSSLGVKNLLVVWCF
jgi:hypothetical protein